MIVKSKVLRLTISFKESSQITCTVVPIKETGRNTLRKAHFHSCIKRHFCKLKVYLIFSNILAKQFAGKISQGKTSWRPKILASVKCDEYPNVKILEYKERRHFSDLPKKKSPSFTWFLHQIEIR